MKPRQQTRLCVERLEDRLTPSYGLGYAVGLPSAGGSSQVAVDAGGNAIVSSMFSAASLDLGPEIGVTEGGNVHCRIIELEAIKTPSRTAAKLVLAAAVASRAIANMMEKTQ